MSDYGWRALLQPQRMPLGKRYIQLALADRDRLAAYIERLEAERDALLAEHEVVDEGYGDETADVGCDCLSCRIIRAHDNAEGVIRGER